MKYKSKLLMKEFVTHDVERFILEKPKNYKFLSGQATKIYIDKEKWKKKGRPFTFTSLNEDKVLEFTIKEYPKHKGVTQQLSKLKSGDKMIITRPFGTIRYKGKGVFIAGGAGVTPFISILRNLKKQNKIKGNKLIFSNKEAKDIILEKEFIDMFKASSKDLIFTLTREKNKNYYYGRIDKKFLKKHVKNFKQNFYVCGPPKFVGTISQTLEDLGAKVDSVIFEGKK